MGDIVINPADNVSVSLEDGHKKALKDIEIGQEIIKYGYPIGRATAAIKKGDRVHSHNLETALGEVLAYDYKPDYAWPKALKPLNIEAYVRQNGDIGLRNDIWIINTVGCVNKTAEKLSEITGAFSFSHPYGCSQLGDDQKVTQLILSGLIKHPNAGGVLVLGLGCENNNIDEMKKVIGDYDPLRVRFLVTQECSDEIEEGKKIIEELKAIASKDKRQSVSIDRLKIGLKCGGSDGLSGITANPLVGHATDRLCAMGASAVLTEVPEMFGAEELLFKRCVSRKIFEEAVQMINNYKKYFMEHGQPIYENPSPGNKEGGITTLEEKSLGCVQKGGSVPIVDVLDYGDTISKPGLSLLNGPGNDIVSITNMTAVGCHLILFTTGRGTPLGGPVPTLKIMTNDKISKLKPHWTDFNAYSRDNKKTAKALVELISQTASGKKAKNEEAGYREIAIFKDGVTL